MQKICLGEDVNTFPDWLNQFVDAAWTEPDRDKQRTPIDRLDPNLSQEFATRINTAMQEHRFAQFHFALDEKGGSFQTTYFWTPDHLTTQIAQKLSQVWSDRLNLANCQTCNALLVPSKGRVTKFCSNKCRIAAHRAGG
ncbi:hypothetical protein PH7735_01791 [Shimia thalassica]|uniref:Uncharacterized protein n=1 Tax=Shimia thalassica TaxID=1715693 RepID=A0A0N7M952_9RHOB|nr:hypothetical protein PH7735_01791 [Shimia thalassica]